MAGKKVAFKCQLQNLGAMMDEHLSWISTDSLNVLAGVLPLDLHTRNVQGPYIFCPMQEDINGTWYTPDSLDIWQPIPKCELLRRIQ